MKITILGSGGFQTIPRPLCQCKICKEAREKGTPYSRNGPSIYIHGADAIIDTPKDIINSVNREDIKKIKNIFFTHWHPDHTEGMRIVEEATAEHKGHELKNHGEPINFIASPEVLKELNRLKSGSNKPYLDWYKYNNFIKEIKVEHNKSKTINKIKFIPALLNKIKFMHTDAWLIQENKKKVLYMPCDVKPFNINPKYLENLDLFMVNSPWTLARNAQKKFDAKHPIREELFSMDEIIELIEKHKIKKTIITHIEEMWRLSYDDYKKLEEKYKKHNIKFAYDGMKIKV